MTYLKRHLAACIALLMLTAGGFAENPDRGAHLPSQAAADVLRDVAQTDGAFLAAGLVKTSYQTNNLASLLQYPTDNIVIVKLSGAQLKQAFERSLSLYPQANTSFLQLSGFEVTFNPNGASGQRVISVEQDGAPVGDAQDYTIAMPSSLGRGGLGYFKIWDKSKIVRTLETTVETALRGKPYQETAPRWIAR